MGLVNAIASSVANTPLGDLVTALFRPARAIGPFATQVTIEEVGIDELVITDHPVAFGAAITDHSFMRPPEIIIRCAFSNSSLAALVRQAQGILSLFTTGSVGPLNYAKQIYAQMLALQSSRIPFSVTTGKRSYQNMLMKSISVETDEKTENILMVTCHCRGVIIVQTAITAVINTNGVTPSPASPADTTAPVNTGTRNLAPASPSPGGALPESAWK